MKVLIDTNVIMDVRDNRLPHFECSEKVFDIIVTGGFGFITATQTKDLFYFVNRNTNSKQRARDVINQLTDDFKVLDVLTNDVQNALSSDMPDYEDALIAHCAARNGMDYIITRNAKDFEASPIAAITPKDFLETNL